MSNSKGWRWKNMKNGLTVDSYLQDWDNFMKYETDETQRQLNEEII